MRKYTLVTDAGGDWVGLYDQDGFLLAEGHSLDEGRVLAALDIPHETREIDFEEANLGGCENDLRDMPEGETY